VLEELAGRWIGLTTVEKNAIATAMAGTRQRENFNIMMENYDEILKATETSLNANGTAEKGYIAITESVSYQMNQMTNAWDELALRMDTNPIFIDLIKGGTDLLKILPEIIQHVLTLVSITRSKSLLGGIKDLGFVFTNLLFGTKLGYKDSESFDEEKKDKKNKKGSFFKKLFKKKGEESDTDETSATGTSSTGSTDTGASGVDSSFRDLADTTRKLTEEEKKKLLQEAKANLQAKKEAAQKARTHLEEMAAKRKEVFANEKSTDAEKKEAQANYESAQASLAAAQADLK
jgi:hypothetical protein